jgi:hypothetical protein
LLPSSQLYRIQDSEGYSQFTVFDESDQKIYDDLHNLEIRRPWITGDLVSVSAGSRTVDTPSEISSDPVGFAALYDVTCDISYSRDEEMLKGMGEKELELHSRGTFLLPLTSKTAIEALSYLGCC